MTSRVKKVVDKLERGKSSLKSVIKGSTLNHDDKHSILEIEEMYFAAYYILRWLHVKS